MIISKRLLPSERFGFIFMAIWTLFIITALIVCIVGSILDFKFATGFSNTEVLIFCLLGIDVIFICMMYLFDIGLKKTDGLLSYIDWSKTGNEPPASTLAAMASTSFGLLFLFAISITADERLKFFSSAGDFQKIIIYMIMGLCATSVVSLLLSFNSFDTLRARGKEWDRTNATKLRKYGWYTYLVSFHFFIVIMGLTLSLLSAIFSIMFFLAYWFFAITYYYFLDNVVYVVTDSQEHLLKYQRLRWKIYVNEKKYLDSSKSTDVEFDEFDNYAKIFVILNKNDVIGGARLIELKDQDAGLPLTGSTSTKHFLQGLEQELEKSLRNTQMAEISRLVLASHFRGTARVERLFRELYHYVRDAGIILLLCTANRETINLYRRLGFEYLQKDKNPQEGYKLSGDWWALYLDLADPSIIQKLDARFGYS